MTILCIHWQSAPDRILGMVCTSGPAGLGWGPRLVSIRISYYTDKQEGLRKNVETLSPRDLSFGLTRPSKLDGFQRPYLLASHFYRLGREDRINLFLELFWNAGTDKCQKIVDRDTPGRPYEAVLFHAEPGFAQDSLSERWRKDPARPCPMIWYNCPRRCQHRHIAWPTAGATVTSLTSSDM